MKAIYVARITGEKKDGTKFNAWETSDTKDKTRMSVSFVQDGKGEPKLGKDEKGVKIQVLDGWVDKRKRFPVLRVRDYEILEKETRKENLDEFFDDDETDE